ncbi:hypothetical protein KBZ21_40410, partial [Streptomyces sp. A73]|nr:hypothetical protein [Streptomyces sp. A73]
TVQTWRSTQLFDALRPEGDDPRAVTKAAQTCGLLYLDDLAAALSWVLATPELAVASTAAFALSETLDFAVSEPLRRRGLLVA